MRADDIERAVREGVHRALDGKHYDTPEPASVVDLLRSIDSRLEQLNNHLEALWRERH